MLHSMQLTIVSEVSYDAPLPRFRHFLQARQQAMRRVRGTEMAAARITEPAIHTNIILGVLASTQKQKLIIMM
jgi:hypothetical protein